ncbi:MAG: preprotein translocase subunit YajC [Endomicrobia bacterium]|nr:preprotein translocase subunit YajC [Endomicrobiia bacterium]
MKSLFSLVAFLLVSISLMPSNVYAQEAAGGGSFGAFMPLILIFVFFYLFLLRPQQKKAKEHQQLLNSLKKDDEIITAGGIYGTVVSVKESIVEVKIANGVNIKLSKPSISTVITKQDDEAVKVPEIIK